MNINGVNGNHQKLLLVPKMVLTFVFVMIAVKVNPFLLVLPVILGALGIRLKKQLAPLMALKKEVAPVEKKKQILLLLPTLGKMQPVQKQRIVVNVV